MNTPPAKAGGVFTAKHADEKGKKFDMPLAYNQEADVASWKETQKFLVEIFK